MKVIVIFLFSLFYLFSLCSCGSTNSTGWVVTAIYKDKACLNIDSYYMNPIGVCVDEGTASEKYILNSDGSVSTLFCGNSSDCSSGCFTFPVSEGGCTVFTSTNTSTMDMYYESFPAKLFDEKKNHLLVQFASPHECNPEGGVVAVIISPGKCIFNSCDSKDSLKKYCKIPEFLINA